METQADLRGLADAGAARLALWHHNDTCRVGINNKLGTRRECSRAGCRRRHSCEGDPHACYTRYLPTLSDDGKAEFRAAIRARVAERPAR